MRRLVRRLRYLCHRRQLERDLQEEMRAHKEMMSDERRPAFGSSLRWREEARDAWGWTGLDHLQQDVAYGVRQLRRAPAFTLMATMVLALGVGLNLAVFHVVKAVSDASVPVPAAESLMRVVRQSPEREAWAFPPDAVAFYREHADLFLHLVGERVGTVPVQVNDDEEDARAQFVTGNYFDDLGVRPVRGRLLGPRDDRAGAPLVAVLSEGYWQRRFGGDPAIVSTIVTVNDSPVLVAGIAPAGFTGLAMSRGELWLATTARSRLLPGVDGPELFGQADHGIAGRLRPGVSPEAASTQLAALTTELRRRLPGMLDEQDTVRARPLGEDQVNRGPYTILGPLVALVLLAACANLGNMLLARGVAREPEIATRVAVGASRRRLVRQLMTESLLLAGLGSLAGLVVGHAGARLLATVFAGSLNVRISTDLPVIAAAASLSLVSALAFGLAPALQLAGRRRHAMRSRQTLVAVQVAASCVLLILAGLMVRGAQRQTALAGGADYTPIVVVDPRLPETNRSGPAARQTLEGIAARLRQLPDAVDVTVAADPIFGVSVGQGPGMPLILQSHVDAGYFRVMRLALLRGRLFQPGERDVVVLGASAARAAFGGDDAVGQVWSPDGRGTGPVVIGVVESSALASLRSAGAVESYLPLTDETVADASVIVRTTGDGRARLRQVRDAASLPNASPSVWLIQTRVDQLLEHSRAATEVIGVLGGAAAGLAALGIFGLMAFSVRERSRELAIRLALGARARAIVAMLVAQYARPLGLGLAAGVLLAAAGERMLGARAPAGLGLLAFDPGGYVLGMIAFTLTALAAILVPLRRAVRIDPASALRCE